MVLSLALVLALIGSGAGLLVGIFAFSEVSDTLECPASGGGSGGTGIIYDSLNIGDTDYQLQNPNNPIINIGTIIPFNGESITKITYSVESSNISVGSVGTLKSVVFSGLDPIDLEAGDNSFSSISNRTFSAFSGWDDDEGNPIHDVVGEHDLVAIYDPPVTLNGNIFVGLETNDMEDVMNVLILNSGDHVIGKFCGERQLPDTASYGFLDCSYEIAVKIEVSTSSSETGSEQCQSAKDIAWSVIGIMPVALFFGLFTLFNFVIPKS